MGLFFNRNKKKIYTAKVKFNKAIFDDNGWEWTTYKDQLYLKIIQIICNEYEDCKIKSYNFSSSSLSSNTIILEYTDKELFEEKIKNQIVKQFLTITSCLEVN